MEIFRSVIETCRVRTLSDSWPSGNGVVGIMTSMT